MLLVCWRPANCSNCWFPGTQSLLQAQATLQLETSSVLLGMPASIARRKRAFERNTYDEVVNWNGIRQVEPIFTHQRQDGSFQLLYNTCPEADAHNNDASFESPPFYGCIGRLVSFSSEGKPVGGETILDFRSLLAEARIVGYWTPLKEPVDGVHSLQDAVFAVWAQRCPSVDSTCECTEARCRISLETSTVKSGYLLFTNKTIFETYKGDRLCVDDQADKTSLNKNSSGKFTYWLVEHTGWVCGREDMHGSYLEFDEQHPDGTRVGSVFAVRLTNPDVKAFEVVRTIWTRARLDYSFGFNALVGGPAKQGDNVRAAGKDPHYAFTIRARSFDVVQGVSESRCFGVILDADFQDMTRKADQIFPCRPCGYAAILLHPQFQELMAVCEDTSEQSSGIYVDGKMISPTQGTSRSLHPAELSSPVFVPDDFRAWKIFWKDVTEAKGGPHMTLNLGEWNQQLQVYFQNFSPVEGIKATGVDLIFASSFGENSILVAYQDSIERTSFLMECSPNGIHVPGNFLKVLRTAEASLLPAAPGAFIMRPSASAEVFWYSFWTEDRVSHDAQDSFLPIAGSTREFRLVKATGSRESAGPCKGG
ncbi:conserved hypothetical protein [Neospora caninum Liverpool]|uniref:Uncharacterized protein n=1 Tax=Neospora caninum (strain Liverpool) TaxID=572307 RepID=F0VEY7_NEOCL|nr:conserved hypothetical protein [Neospora caninum Liverpool]CBZ52281.1 conserved hypothetical protein [Neospora caninum Liverpool]CEL66249.1 TPA: hypothetical protein BN1204_020680 [Neospora caninum Liverpool]|eukprot:XP_003882313.1 conserved hypothetical protein [Neospora caninum Liverpool]